MRSVQSVEAWCLRVAITNSNEECSLERVSPRCHIECEPKVFPWSFEPFQYLIFDTRVMTLHIYI